jgi:hypothetical protein
LIIALVVFAMDLLRKHLVIQDIIDKNSEYANSSNYYIKIRSYYGDYYTIEEDYVKDEKILQKFSNFNGEIVQTCDQYTENGKVRNYINSGDEKIFDITESSSDFSKSESIMEYVLTSSIFKKESKLDYIKMLMKLDISTENCNGKECYKISDVGSNGGSIDVDKTYLGYTEYVDKETGLLVRLYDNMIYEDDYEEEKTTSVEDYSYEFDSVTDEDFIEPDISEYKEV